MLTADHACGLRETVDKIWRAAEQARDDDRVEETESPAQETEGEKWRRKKWEQGTNRKEESNTVHVVFHFASAATPTTTAATAAVRLQ